MKETCFRRRRTQESARSMNAKQITLAVAARRKLSEVEDARASLRIESIHDISGNRSSTNHRLTILEVRLHLAVSTAETSDGVPNSGLGQTQVSVPRIDGREIRLQAACGHLTLLPQIPKVGEQVGRACRERGDWRLPLLLLHTRAEIEPTLELAGIAAPGRGATACNEELRRHPFAREVVRQLA